MPSPDSSPVSWKMLFLGNTVNLPKQNTMITTFNMPKAGRKESREHKMRISCQKGQAGEHPRPQRHSGTSRIVLVALWEVWPKEGGEEKLPQVTKAQLRMPF